MALWFLASFFLLGDLGKYNDDWYYVQRDPASGAVEAWVMARPVHFWRPLYRVIVPPLITAFWRHDWVVHLISAAAHGGVAVLVWRLLRELRAPRLGAAVGALVFLVWPAYFEAVLWMCCLPTVLSAGVVVAAWIVYVRWAREELGWWAVAAMPVMFFTSACLNEQAAMGAAAMPFLYGAACGLEGRRRVLVRGVGPALLGAAALAAYVAMHVGMHFRPPATSRPEFFMEASGMPRQAMALARWLRSEFVSGGFFGRGCGVGWETVREHPLRAWMCGAALAAGLAGWVHTVAAREPERGARAEWMGAAGVVAFLAPLAPIIAFSYWFDSRVTYAPALGIPLLIGAASAALARVGRPAWVRRAVATAIGAGLVLPALAMVGLQRGYQVRAARDASEVAQLKALVPSPAPATVFVPVKIEMPRISGRGSDRYDLYYWSPFQSWWSARWILRMGYGRADLNCGQATWGESGVLRQLPRQVLVRDVGWVANERVVRFEIDGEGRVSLAPLR